MDKMAIVGDADSIQVFKAGGVDTFGAESSEKVKELIRKLAKEYKIIFLTEEFASELNDFLKRFKEQPYPIILAVPGKNGTNGYGIERLRYEMERALGVDILFSKEDK